MSSIPVGAWFGIAILLLGSWAKDIRGMVIGVVVIAVTVIAVYRRQSLDEAADEPTTGTDPAS